MDMYRASWSGIEKYKIVKETEKTVTYEYDGNEGTIMTNREHKRTENQCWFPTWQEAKDHLIATATGRVKRAQGRLDYQLKELEKAKNLTQVGEE